jgi:hypothetical protein
MRPGGPALLGTGAWLDAMIDAVDGRGPGLLPAGDHASLRAVLLRSEAGGAPSAPALVATVMLPRDARDRVLREMGGDLAGRAVTVASSVLGVRAAGAAVDLGRPGGQAELRAELRCDAPAACDEVRGLLLRERLARSQDLALRLVGLGPLIDSIDARAEGAALHVSARFPADELGRLARAPTPPTEPP